MSYNLRKYKGRSKNWYVRITTPEGIRGNWISTRQSKRGRAVIVAEKWDREIQDHREVVTLETAYQYLAAQMVRKGDTPETLESLELKGSHVQTFLGADRDIDTIELEDTEAYFDMRVLAGVKKSTIAKEMSYLTAALRRCQQLGKYTKSFENLWPPALPKKFAGRKRWLPPEEYERLLPHLAAPTGYERQQTYGPGKTLRRAQRIEHADGMGTDWRDHLTAYIYTGMRLKDLYSIQGRHVRADDVLHILGTKTDGANRFVPIATAALAMFKRRAAEAGPDGFLFPMASPTLRAQSRAWLRALERACEAAGMEHVSTNDLRRTFASWCWQNDVAEGVCVQWMGHTSNRMVRQVYAQQSPEQARREIEKLPGGKVVSIGRRRRPR